MHEDKQKLVNDARSVFDYPLFHLGNSSITLATLIGFVAILVIVFILEQFLRRMLIPRFLKRTQFHPSMQYAIGKMVGYVVIAVGFDVALRMVGVDLSSLEFIAGAIGVGLGFGLQNVISNFVSGVIILAERPIAIGDRVEIGDIAGLVQKINLRSTNILTNDNITIIVPNSDFITSKVTNWSYGDPKVRIRVPIGVAYGTDLEKLKRILLEVAAEQPKALRTPEPDVFFVSFGDSSLNFELSVWTEEMTSKPRVFRSQLNFALERKLREHKIEVPFPQRDLHLRSGNFVLQPASKSEEPPPAQREMF